MKNKIIKKYILPSLLIIFVIISFSVKLLVFNNADLLCIIAEGFDEPSSQYYFIVKKIFELSTKKNIEVQYLNNIKDNKNEYLHSQYIRILGVIGELKSIPVLKKYYLSNHKNKTKKLELYFAVKGLGLIGDEEAIPFLRDMQVNRDEGRSQVDESTIVTSLYLITGNSDYHFTNALGKRQKLHLSKGLRQAREVILSSKGKKRTVNEMIILDKLFRPPGSKWGSEV